ncbi:hypothetical protein BGZ63DRAFT_429393 [Mariannaea sp. PMI_226]|nr:hypothetical protein BGZ63DRAFT_429393 [Mariannaea sp. PMI_226]
MANFTALRAAFMLLVPLAVAKDSRGPVQAPATVPIDHQLTSHGCFKKLSATASHVPVTFVSTGSCHAVCEFKGKAVMITRMSQCFCSDTYPPRLSLVDDSQCSSPCPGYSYQACGGQDAYSVFNMGLQLDVKYDDDTQNPDSDPSQSALIGLYETMHKFTTEVNTLVEEETKSCPSNCIDTLSWDKIGKPGKESGASQQAGDL